MILGSGAGVGGTFSSYCHLSLLNMSSDAIIFTYKWVKKRCNQSHVLMNIFLTVQNSMGAGRELELRESFQELCSPYSYPSKSGFSL